MIKINIPIYEGVLFVGAYEEFTLDSIKKISKVIEEKKHRKGAINYFWEQIGKGNKDDFEYEGLSMSYCQAKVIVLYDGDYSKPNTINTLTHEIFHIADKILRGRGFTLSDDSQEAWAYLIGYISGEVFKHIINDIKHTKTINQEVRGTS